MDRNLEDLIAGATSRLLAVESQSERDAAERSRNTAARQAAAYRRRIQKALGSNVMDCLQPVTYENSSEVNQMAFNIDGMSFELRQAAGTAVDLLQGSRELFQFDLASPMARDHFLRALGAVVSRRE